MVWTSWAWRTNWASKRDVRTNSKPVVARSSARSNSTAPRDQGEVCVRSSRGMAFRKRPARPCHVSLPRRAQSTQSLNASGIDL